MKLLAMRISPATYYILSLRTHISFLGILFENTLIFRSCSLVVRQQISHSDDERSKINTLFQNFACFDSRRKTMNWVVKFCERNFVLLLSCSYILNSRHIQELTDYTSFGHINVTLSSAIFALYEKCLTYVGLCVKKRNIQLKTEMMEPNKCS